MAKKMDIRVVRTRQNIIRAFVDLANEEGIDAVTVQQIADRAMINRATFYAHFTDKDDLYEQVFRLAMGTFSPLRAPELFRHGHIQADLVTTRLAGVFKEVKRQREIFLLILNNTNSTKLLDQLKQMLKSNIAGVLLKLGIRRNSNVPSELVLTYLVSTFIGVLQWWLRTDTKMSARQLAKLYVELMRNGHLKLVGIKVE